MEDLIRIKHPPGAPSAARLSLAKIALAQFHLFRDAVRDKPRELLPLRLVFTTTRCGCRPCDACTRPSGR